MKKILISIISDQTIPNSLVIKELENQYDSNLFITTSRMEKEGKSKWIEKAAGISEGSIPRIEVDENNWKSITEKLQKHRNPEFSYIVNLTCGTKIMTLAIYDYFSHINSRIIYVPIGKNKYEELYPVHSDNPIPINYRLNLTEYLYAHGILFEKKDKLFKSYDDLKKIYKSFIIKNYDVTKFNNDYPGEWKNYYVGGWFEEYLYYKIKKDLNLPDSSIFTNVSLTHFNNVNPLGNDKELDVVFTLDNELYIVEAKSSIGIDKINMSMLDKIMFKLSAINKHFGLRSYVYIITMADLSNENFKRHYSLSRKSKVLGIKSILDRNTITCKDFSYKTILN